VSHVSRAARWLWREQRRFFFGVAILVAATVLLLEYFSDLQALYRSLCIVQNRNTVAFYTTFGGLLVLASLTSVFPASVLGVLAGVVFGTVNGFLLSAASFMLSALLAFVFGRYFFRKAIRRIVAKVFDLERLEVRLARFGWRYALQLRLAPIAPFGITSYGLGLTPIGFVEYTLTTLGTFPFLLVCVYLGSVGGLFVGQSCDLDRRALWQLAFVYTVVTLIMAVALHFLTRWVRLKLGPEQGESELLRRADSTPDSRSST
jgi:uncharacterized membrane protein YdjX (TVP38/TMEM64 family)